LCEDWEITPDRIVYRVRSGIYWAPTEDQIKRGVMKEAREFTADDWVNYMNMYLHSKWGRNISPWVEKIYAEGNSVVIEAKKSMSWYFFYQISYEDRPQMYSPETIAAGAGEWKNIIGTGPFMFDEYVPGAYMKYKRNPNYWRTTTINGKEYQLPFVDDVTLPIIPDLATRAAALKTGVIDFFRLVPSTQWDMLDETAPELEKATFSTAKGVGFDCRMDIKPFSDLKVRQAVMVGVNRAEFASLYHAEAVPENLTNWWPIFPTHPSYIPLGEYPEDYQRLWSYNPTLAKQLLTEALGPPDANGIYFKTTMLVESEPRELDAASLLKDQLAKIGIDVELDVKDRTAYTLALNIYLDKPGVPPEWTGMVWKSAWVSVGPFIDVTSSWTQNYTSYGPTNYMMWHDELNEEFTVLIDKAAAELDPGKQGPYLQAAAKILAPHLVEIPATLPPDRMYWWPWVKNYSGELTLTDDARISEMVALMWLDQDLKAKMGY